jgi:hypothetical protein
MATVAKSDRSTLITLASATAGPFDLDFRLFDTDTLDVFVNYEPRTDWTLNATFIDGYTDSAAITFDAALADGDVIVINGELYPDRPDDYLNSGGLVRKLNIEFGRIWSSLSEQYRNNRRSLRFFQPVDPVRLEADRALVGNAGGDGVTMGPSVDEIENAQGYAEAASASADLASDKASEAATSETNAANSATAAASSASAAAGSASAASTSASAAATSESNASTSETNAASSASAAASSASAAASSASDAATSETNASTSETNAATSATNAATSASNASTSASAAATSATNAANSASSAATSASDAEQAKDDTIAALDTKVGKTGDTMTGDLIVIDEELATRNNGSSGASAFVGERHDVLAGEALARIRARSKDASNIRTRDFLTAEATEDHNIPGNQIGWKGVAHYVPQGASGGQEALEWSELGPRGKANGGDWENLVKTPVGWGAGVSDSAASNDTVFATMEANLGGGLVDLQGFTFPVGSVPDLPGAVRGFFEEENALGNADLSHPAGMTMLKATTNLTWGLCNSTWAQDNACWDDRMQEGYVAFSENNNHGVQDGSARVVIMRSRDGISWSREEVDLGFPCTVWGHRVYGGFQMLIVRDESGGANDGKFYLYGRQLAQRVELTGLRNIASGDNRYRFDQGDFADEAPLMLYETALVQFRGLPTNLGGHDLNAEDNVAYRSSQDFEFRAPSNFSSVFDHSGIFEMNVRQSDWYHITFDGGETLGEAIESAGGGSGEPAIIHGIYMWRDGTKGGQGVDDFASRGDFFVGVSGGQFNAAVAKIRNIVDENNKGDVQWIAEIPGAASGLSEVTVQTFPDSDKACGFIRTEDENSGQTTPAAFWSSDDIDSGIGTVTLTDLPTGAFEISPISLTRAGPETGTDLVAFASLERNGDDSQGTRRMVALRATEADAFASGASAFQTVLVEKSEYRNQTLSGGATGVGVPSITRWGRTGLTFAAFWNREVNTNDPYAGRLDTVTEMMATKFTFEPNEMRLMGPEHIRWGAIPAPRWRVKLRGTPAETNGSIIEWNNVDAESAPTGYDAGVLPIPVSGRYRIHAAMSYEPNTGTNYILLRTGDDSSHFAGQETWLAPAYNDITTDSRQSYGASSISVFAKGGETMAFKVNATGGITSSNVRNFVEVELLEMF